MCDGPARLMYLLSAGTSFAVQAFPAGPQSVDQIVGIGAIPCSTSWHGAQWAACAREKTIYARKRFSSGLVDCEPLPRLCAAAAATVPCLCRRAGCSRLSSGQAPGSPEGLAAQQYGGARQGHRLRVDDQSRRSLTITPTRVRRRRLPMPSSMALLNQTRPGGRLQPACENGSGQGSGVGDARRPRPRLRHGDSPLPRPSCGMLCVLGAGGHSLMVAVLCARRESIPQPWGRLVGGHGWGLHAWSGEGTSA